MCQVAFEVPNTDVQAAGMDEKTLNRFSQQMLAAGLFHTGKLSLGRCAQVAGMCEADFVDFLSELGIKLWSSMTAEDVQGDVSAAEALLRA